MRILLLPKYGSKAASYRYRFQQYLPALEAAGFDYEISSLLSDRYLVQKFETGRRRIWPVIQAFLQRIRALASVGRYDLVIIHYEIFPYFPSIPERYLKWRKVPYIIDLDDATFHSYDQSARGLVRMMLGKKIGAIIGGAAKVFAGNNYLAEYSRQTNPHQVVVLPTVVDLKRYRTLKSATTTHPETFTIGWIGAPSTAYYLDIASEALRIFCARHPDARVVLVGSGPVQMTGFPIEVREWTEKTEIDDILTFDIGIMPLTDSPWSRGKCGFKLIQYMACGIPVIGSAVGTNKDIVEDGKNGFLVSSTEEWLAALESAYANRTLMTEFGQEGRRKIEKRYSLQSATPIFIESIRAAISENPDPRKCSTPRTDELLNMDPAVVEGFGDEWKRFDQKNLSETELRKIFDLYFKIFPWSTLPPGAVGFDAGCGSGRWAKFVAPKVGRIHCVDPSAEALEVARKNLEKLPNAEFHLASVGKLPFADQSMDFGYSLGVLHHIPNTERGLRECVRKLKPGAPFLLYLYYALDDRPWWFRALWHSNDVLRRGVSHLPSFLRTWISEALAATVYFPLARGALLFEKIGFSVSLFPLAFYRDLSYYTMRTDARDRFGTRIEKRFSAAEILKMMTEAGLEGVEFSPTMPMWCALGYKCKSAASL